MKRPFLRKLTAAAAAFCAAAALLLPVSAERQYENCITNVGVYDLQGEMSEEDLELATRQVQETSENINMYVAVYICGDDPAFYSDSQVEAYADDQYDALFNPQYGVDTDGVLLVVTYGYRYVYLSTSGMGQLYYSNAGSQSRTDRILDDFTPALQSGNNLSVVYTFCRDLESYYKAGIENDAYTYDEANDTYYYNSGGTLVSSQSLPWWYGINWNVLLPVAAIIGLVAAAIAALCVRNSYQLKKSLSPINYVSQQDTNFYVQDDLFLRKHVSRTHISSDSGGGGGGGGHSHMSSGGHSHGGGGHHF